MLMSPRQVAFFASKRVCLLATLFCAVAFSSASGAQSLPSESAQSFEGTVSCVDVVNPARSKTWETRVVFDRPVGRDMAYGAAPVATQVGGLAGEWLGGRKRSEVAAWLGTAAGGPVPKQVQFTIAASAQWGSYAETGAWVIGVDANRKATLQGRSRVATMVDPSVENAGRVAAVAPREPSLPLAVPQNPQAKPWSATCTWNLWVAAAPAGMIPYEYYDGLFIPPRLGVPVAVASSPSKAGGCGSTWTNVANGLFVTAAFVAIPTGGAVWAAILTTGAVGSVIASEAPSSACLESELGVMSQQISILQAQVAQIDAYLGLATNALYLAWYENEIEQAGTAAYLWNQNIKGISPTGVGSTGLFGNFMVPNGVGLWNYQLQPSASAPADPLQLALNDTPSAMPIARPSPRPTTSDAT